MWYGGARMIRLYQCGLTEQRLYTGEIDGIRRPELTKALEKCVLDKAATRCPPKSSAAPPRREPRRQVAPGFGQAWRDPVRCGELWRQIRSIREPDSGLTRRKSLAASASSSGKFSCFDTFKTGLVP